MFRGGLIIAVILLLTAAVAAALAISHESDTVPTSRYRFGLTSQSPQHEINISALIIVLKAEYEQLPVGGVVEISAREKFPDEMVPQPLRFTMTFDEQYYTLVANRSTSTEFQYFLRRMEGPFVPLGLQFALKPGEVQSEVVLDWTQSTYYYNLSSSLPKKLMAQLANQNQSERYFVIVFPNSTSAIRLQCTGIYENYSEPLLPGFSEQEFTFTKKTPGGVKGEWAYVYIDLVNTSGWALCSVWEYEVSKGIPDIPPGVVTPGFGALVVVVPLVITTSKAFRIFARMDLPERLTGGGMKI
jgi:hypothetical protein